MKVFFFFSILHELYGRVATRLRGARPELSFAGLVYGADQVRVLRDLDFPTDELISFTQFLSTRLDHEPDIAALRAWESEHGIPLSYLIAADRLYRRKRRDETVRLASAAIQCVKEALDRTSPDVIVAEGIDCLLSYVLYYEAQARGLPFLITYASTLPRRFAVYSNPVNRWEEVDARYAVLRTDTLTDAQIDVADGVIASYTREKVVPSYMGAYRRIFYPRRDVSTIARVVRRTLFDPMHRYNPTYHGSIASVVAQRLLRLGRATITKGLFDPVEPGERFVLFPLQLQPEASTLVFAPFFTDQVYAAECVAKSLPIDHVLYVKEHPVMIGRRPLSEYRRLKAIPNVRLISPSLHSHDLIRDASAVAVITSTVGWEAAVYQKPVLVIGNVWYDGFDIVKKIHSVVDLPSEVHRAMHSFSPNVNLLRCAVLAVLDGTHPGEIENPAFNASVLDDSNVSAIAEALARYLPASTAAVGNPSRSANLASR